MANTLAIASPYLVAAALYLTLYLSHTPVPRTVEFAPPPPPPPVNGPSVTTNTEGLKTPVAPAQPARKQTPAAQDHKKAASTTTSTAPAPPQPVPVDPRIAGTMKLSGDPPSYPPIAHAARVQGIVVVDVVIGPTGFVQDAHVISGPPLLQSATIDAIRAWHYRPWLVYGKPMPFETQVSIDFKIDVEQ